MNEKNKSMYAILGFINMGVSTGYDIKKAIDSSISNFWHESYSNIYPILNKLCKLEFIQKSAPPEEGKPNKIEYTITEKGKVEFQNWLLQNPDFDRPKIELLLKLFFGKELQKEQCISFIQTRKKLCEEALKKYEALSKVTEHYAEENPDAKYWLVTLNYGKRDMEAQIQWCVETIEVLNA